MRAFRMCFKVQNANSLHVYDANRGQERHNVQFVSVWGYVCCARRIPVKGASLRTCMCKLNPKVCFSMYVDLSLS